MPVCDTSPAFFQQPVLVALIQQLTKFFDINARARAKPIWHIWLPQIVIRHERIHLQGVNVGKDEVPHEGNRLPTQIAPEISRILHLPVELRVASHQIFARDVVDQPHGAIEPVLAPIEAIRLASMIGVDSRSVPDNLPELLKPFDDSGTGRGFIRDAVQGDLKPLGLEVQDKVSVDLILQRISAPYGGASRRQWPDSLRSNESVFVKEIVYRAYVFDVGSVGIVNYCEGESFALRPHDFRCSVRHN